MGEVNTVEEKINNVPGNPGQIKVSQGPGLPSIWQDLPGGGGTYTELDGSVSTTANALGLGDGAWGNWDLSATLPVGAFVAEIAITKLVASDTAGLRKDGSALNRSFTLVKLQVVVLTVEIIASRIVKIMSGDVSDLDNFQLVGYWA